VFVKNDRRFDRRFSPLVGSVAIGGDIRGAGDAGAGLPLNDVAAAAVGAETSSSCAIGAGVGDGFRELMGEGEGNGCV